MAYDHTDIPGYIEETSIFEKKKVPGQLVMTIYTKPPLIIFNKGSLQLPQTNPRDFKAEDLSLRFEGTKWHMLSQEAGQSVWSPVLNVSLEYP